MVAKDLFQRLKNKQVTIKLKLFGSNESNYQGIVVNYYYGSGTEMFLELDTKDIINTKYIASISVDE